MLLGYPTHSVRVFFALRKTPQSRAACWAAYRTIGEQSLDGSSIRQPTEY